MVCDIVTENLIKGIIVAHSRNGITIKQIANVFHRCTGHSLPLVSGVNEKGMEQYLKQIDGIFCFVNEKNENVWYVRGKTLNGENRGKIYRSNNQPEFDLSNQSAWQQPHGSQSNTCMPRCNNSNKNNFGNGRGTCCGERNCNGHVNHTSDHNNNNRNYASRNNMQQRFHKNNGMNVNERGFGVTGTCDSPGINQPKTGTGLYNYDLVGDDFFLELATIDLECIASRRKTIKQSGLCISGQSIRDATDRIRRLPEQPNMKIIVNLGSVDILHGNDLTDLCQDFKELVKECQRRRIQPIITTLAPLANRLHCTAEKLRKFNEFLIKEFSDRFCVIDITPCLVDKLSGRLMFSCYQPEPKYMTGSNQPHLLWNRIGRQRILKIIKKNLPI